MSRAVVIDFDETLVDLRVDWQRLRLSVEEVFAKYGIKKINLHPLTSGIVNGLTKVQDSEKVKREVYEVFDRIEIESLVSSVVVPGAFNLVEGIRGKGYKIIIYSANNESVVSKGLQMHNLIVDEVIGRTLNGLVKSNPLAYPVFKEAISSYNVQLVIGDSSTDEMVAQYLNVPSCRVHKDKLQDQVQQILNLL